MDRNETSSAEGGQTWAGSAPVLSCEAVDELAGAYALDALPDEELRAVREHLDSCSQPHAGLRDLAETATLLASLAAEEAAPEGLGARIMASARADLNEPPHRAPEPEPGAARVVAFPRDFHTPTLLSAIAAAFALLALGLGVWGLRQHTLLAERSARLQSDQLVLTALIDGGRAVPVPGTGALATGLLVQSRNGGPAYLVVDAPPPGGGRVYQAWFIVQGQPASAGVFGGSTSGPQVIRLSSSASGAQAVAVTIEPSGGSRTPTGPKVMQQNLS